MPDKVRIALDAMGGDEGASVAVPGADLSLQRHADIEFLLFGDEAKIAPLLTAPLKAVSRLVHTDVASRVRRSGTDGGNRPCGSPSTRSNAAKRT